MAAGFLVLAGLLSVIIFDLQLNRTKKWRNYMKGSQGTNLQIKDNIFLKSNVMDKAFEYLGVVKRVSVRSSH